MALSSIRRATAIHGDLKRPPGLVASAHRSEGQAVIFAGVEFDDNKVKIGSKHPLAGKDLSFALELAQIA